MNQSLLKKILISPSSYLKTKEEMYIDTDEDHYRLGHLFDFIMTEDMSTFKEHYVVDEGDFKTSETIFGILNQAASEMDYSDDNLIAIAKNFEYGKNWKNETILDKIKTEGWEQYVDFRINAVGKKMVSLTEYNNCVMSKLKLTRNKYTKKYFSTNSFIEIQKKVVITNVVSGVSMKYELDKVVINHKAKKIQPIDYKTMSGSTSSFMYNFWKLRYDFQGAMYWDACLDHYEDLMSKGYTVLPFRFIVVEPAGVSEPMIYQMSEETHLAAMRGTEIPPKTVEGVQQAIERLTWHMTNDEWDYPMEYYEKGCIII